MCDGEFDVEIAKRNLVREKFARESEAGGVIEAPQIHVHLS